MRDPRRSKPRRLVRSAACAAALAGLSPAVGAPFQWTGTPDGVFTDAANWSPTGSPGAADDVFFGSGLPAYTVRFSGGENTASLTVTNGGADFLEDSDGDVYTVDGLAFIDNNATLSLLGLDLDVGGELIVDDNATLDLGTAVFAPFVVPARVTVAGDATVTGNGTVLVDGVGTSMRVDRLFLFDGLVDVAGTTVESLFQTTGTSSSLGGVFNGAPTLRVRDGGRAVFSGVTFVGSSLNTANEDALLEVLHGTVEAGNLIVGGGDATDRGRVILNGPNTTDRALLRHSPGGSLTVGGVAGTGEGRFELSSGSDYISGTGPTTVEATGTLRMLSDTTLTLNGNLTVNGGDAFLRQTRFDDTLTVAPDLILTIQAGGLVSVNGEGDLDLERTTLDVTGLGSRLQLNDDIDLTATGSLRFRNDATALTLGLTRVIQNGATPPSLSVESGAIVQLGNTLINDGQVVVDQALLSFPTGGVLSLENGVTGSVRQGGELRANGVSLEGQLDVTDAGSSFSGDNVSLRGFLGQIATLTVRNAASANFDGLLHLDSSARVEVNTAGTLTTDTLRLEGSGNELVVDGVGSLASVTQAGNVDVGSVGFSSTNRLTVRNGGLMNVGTLSLFAPLRIIGNGELLVDNGTLNADDGLAVIGGDAQVINGASLDAGTRSISVQPDTGGGPGTFLLDANSTASGNALTVLADGTATINGFLDLFGGVDVSAGGTLRGEGLIEVNTFSRNAGLVDPGDGPTALGALVFANLTTETGQTFIQTAAGTLHIDLGPDGGGDSSAFDQLVAGPVTLDGTLALNTLPGFVPSLYQPLDVVAGSSITGRFDLITGVNLGGGLGLAVTYDDPQDLLVTAALLGDANLDGAISQADLDAVLLNWGQTARDWATGDFTGDGNVGQADLDAVLLGWGDTAENAGSVPEPSVLVLMACGTQLLRRVRP